MRLLAAALLLLPGCGGRSLMPPDAGADGAGGDGDADSDADSDAGGGPVRCYDDALDCPPELPFCCWEDSFAQCLATPEWNPDSSESGCTELLDEESYVPFDCFRAFPEPELCPAGYPHCCSYADYQEVCVDHRPAGWRCDR